MGREGVTLPTFGNSGIPSISRERLKLETSNLARRLATGGRKQNNAKLLLEFCDPLHISGTVEVRNFKFGIQIAH